MSKRRAFTLIEILVTILIFGILVSLTGYVYASSLKRSRDSQRVSDLQTIKNSLEQFYLDNKSYPRYDGSRGSIYLAKWQLEKGVGACASPNKAFLAPTYLTTIPEDPLSKLDKTKTCGFLTGANQSGQYLYFVDGKNDAAPKTGYYLAARLEKSANWTAADTTQLQANPPAGYGYADLSGLNFCSTVGVNGCSHDYKLTSSVNN